MTLVVRKKMCVEERYVPMSTSYAQIVFMEGSLGQHAHHAHCVKSF